MGTLAQTLCQAVLHCVENIPRVLLNLLVCNFLSSQSEILSNFLHVHTHTAIQFILLLLWSSPLKRAGETHPLNVPHVTECIQLWMLFPLVHLNDSFPTICIAIFCPASPLWTQSYTHRLSPVIRLCSDWTHTCISKCKSRKKRGRESKEEDHKNTRTARRALMRSSSPNPCSRKDHP